MLAVKGIGDLLVCEVGTSFHGDVLVALTPVPCLAEPLVGLVCAEGLLQLDRGMGIEGPAELLEERSCGEVFRDHEPLLAAVGKTARALAWTGCCHQRRLAPQALIRWRLLVVVR